MLKLQTPVTDEKCTVGISYSDRILLMGSCFSDNIGGLLEDYGFDVCINPFGTLYNPVSVTNSLKRIAGGWEFREEDCVQMGSGSELFCSFSHHTSFARRDKTGFVENANDVLCKAHEFYNGCSRVIVTLGTAWCFLHKESGEIVSNCLKRNAGEFERVRLDVRNTVNMLGRMVETSGKRFIFTVSPIRHLKDGAHGNQISKSILLMAVDEVCRKFPEQCCYFPAYEIMQDELRDYRFYAEDMVHPSAQAVKYIGERFLDWALPSSEKSMLEENIRRFRQSQHISKLQ